MEANIQEVVNSFARQISDLSVKLAIAEARLASIIDNIQPKEEQN